MGKFEAAAEFSRDQSLNPVLSALADSASQLNSDEGEQLADDYLNRHPAVARTSVADVAGEAFRAVSSITSWILSDMKDEDALGQRQTHSARVRTSARRRPTPTEDSVTALPSLSFENPWVVVICALLITAVSTGVAVGALVHARVHARAREPLLSTLLQDVAMQPSRE